MQKYKMIFLFLIAISFMSCNKGIVSIKNNILHVGEGVNDDISISKLKNISSMEDYPIDFDIDTKVVLKMNYFKKEVSFKNNKTEYFNKEGVVLKLKKNIQLYEKNRGYYWMINNDIFDVFPLKFQNNSWYKIDGIVIYGEVFYMYFYVNKKGEIKEYLRRVSYSPV